MSDKLAEARMILDHINGWLRSGEGLQHARDLICTTFGGYNESHLVGCWLHPQTKRLVWDRSVAFDVAIPRSDYKRFRQLAFALAQGMEYVYLRDPHGIVEITKVPVERFFQTGEEIAN